MTDSCSRSVATSEVDCRRRPADILVHRRASLVSLSFLFSTHLILFYLSHRIHQVGKRGGQRKL